MSELQAYFVEYLKQYISVLTRDRQEFFLSLCDIEEELLQGLNISALTQYHVVIVNKGDYAEAVRLRNDMGVDRIVLLSGEGIKQIDSLKDFNEYSVLCEDRIQLWDCLEKALTLRMDTSIRTFLNVILEQSEVSFYSLLQYLYESMGKNQIVVQKLNQNLPMLGIWKSNEKEILKKGQLRKMIRASQYQVIENRLTRAIMDHKITPASRERIIACSLSQGNVQKIMESMCYEDIKEHLKNPPRHSNSSTVEEAVGETTYDFSYTYKLLEHVDKDIEEIEEAWIEEKKQDNLGQEPEWQPLVHNSETYCRRMEKLLQTVSQLNLSTTKIAELQELIKTLQTAFAEAWKGVIEATPVCLAAFCNRAEKYTYLYLHLMATIMTDEKMRSAIAKSEIVKEIHLLFCDFSEDKIKMPFYHPVCVFYYMGIRQMYEYVMKSQVKDDVVSIKDKIQHALIKKVGMQFPLEFMEYDEQQYALDYTTVWQSNAVEFNNIKNGVVYSALDFRIIQQQILDFILKHPYLTEITIALIDISDLGGLISLVGKIRQLSVRERCNIGRVNFQILSYKEEELKKQLTQMWDAIGMDDIVRFRFGRGEYCKQGRYDIERIVQGADMIVMADNSVLYHAPRMIQQRTGRNVIYNRIQKLNLPEQVNNYFKYGKTDISTLWDTLTHGAKDKEEGLWTWKSKEIDNGMLSYINQIVESYENKTIVALSSNEHIMEEIYKTEYILAYRRNDNGKSITIINFDCNNRSKKLPMEGDIRVGYSLTQFYNEALELKDIQQDISTDITDVHLDMNYRNGQFECDCSAYSDSWEKWEEQDNDWSKLCAWWIEWQIDKFLEDVNVLSNYFRDVWRTQWYEKARSLPAVLMVEKLCKGNNILFQFQEKSTDEKNQEDNIELDSMEAVKIHEIIHFAVNKPVIDESVVSQFKEQYEVSILERIIECDAKNKLLDLCEREKLLEIRERIKEN